MDLVDGFLDFYRVLSDWPDHNRTPPWHGLGVTLGIATFALIIVSPIWVVARWFQQRGRR